MTLSPTQEGLLRALAQGYTLKSHRYLDGRKVYRLHDVDGTVVETVRRSTVEVLRERGLIDSNMKFPAATYLLTGRGKQIAGELLSNDSSLPLSPWGWRE